MKVCKKCKTRLSIYNFDKRCLCHACIKIADKDIIESPAAEKCGKKREYEMRKRAERDEY